MKTVITAYINMLFSRTNLKAFFFHSNYGITTVLRESYQCHNVEDDNIEKEKLMRHSLKQTAI
jgi:hypothetical protein